MRKYPEEVAAFIRAHAHEGSIQNTTERVNKQFGTDYTYTKIKTYFSNHRIHAAPKKGRTYPERRITSPEIDAFIFRHYKGTGPLEMTEKVNARFGTGYTREQMKAYYSRNHLDSGLTGYFTKGRKPFNKGKLWNDFMSQEAQANSRKTTFQQGNIPHNGGAPVGTLRLRKPRKNRPHSKPYYWEKIAEPNVWRMKHTLEWEKHNGAVPEGCIVTFANGDTLDWSVGNLVLTTRAQHAVRNRLGIHSYNLETAKAANKIADIKMAVNRVKKRQKGERKRE